MLSGETDKNDKVLDWIRSIEVSTEKQNEYIKTKREQNNLKLRALAVDVTVAVDVIVPSAKNIIVLYSLNCREGHMKKKFVAGSVCLCQVKGQRSEVKGQR